MKAPITWMAIALSAACAPAANDQPRSPVMTSNQAAHALRGEQHERALRQLYEQAINGRRLELLAQLVSAEYVGPRGERGPEGFAQTIRGLTTGVPDLRFEVEHIVASDRAAAVRWKWTGRHSGVLFGLAPSDKTISNTGIGLYRFDDAGKILGSEVETDRLGLLQQLGLVDASLGAPRPAR